MREFFCGWKRKIGVVTLATVCVFAAIWIRSEMVIEEQYSQTSEVRDPSIRLPRNATRIHLWKQGMRYRATFGSDSESVNQWIRENRWSERIESKDDVRLGPCRAIGREERELFRLFFDDIGLSPPAELAFYSGTISERGGGVLVFFDCASSLATVMVTFR